MKKLNQVSHTKAPGGAGPFAIFWAAMSGRLDKNPTLKRELGFFVLLQLFAIGMAVISGVLGFSRAQTFFSGTSDPFLFGLLTTIFIAASAYFFVNHVMSRIAFRAQGGIFDKGQLLALFVSALLAMGVIFLDYQMNVSGIAPASEILTQDAKSSNAEKITSRYNQEIQDAQKDLAANQANFRWKGKVWIPARGKSTKWHPKSQVEAYYKSEDRLNALKEAKIQELANDGQVVQADFSRFMTEVNGKQDILSILVNFMYFLIALSTFRAALFANLVMDYLDANPYGDIPGTQEDHYGPPKFNITPTPPSQNMGVGSIGFKQGFVEKVDKMDIPEKGQKVDIVAKMDIPEKGQKVDKMEQDPDTKKVDILAKMDIPEKGQKVDSLFSIPRHSGHKEKWTDSGQNPTRQKVSILKVDKTPQMSRKPKLSQKPKMDTKKKLHKSGQKVSIKMILDKAEEMRNLEIPITLASISSRMGTSAKTVRRKLADESMSIKDLK